MTFFHFCLRSIELPLLFTDDSAYASQEGSVTCQSEMELVIGQRASLTILPYGFDLDDTEVCPICPERNLCKQTSLRLQDLHAKPNRLADSMFFGCRDDFSVLIAYGTELSRTICHLRPREQETVTLLSLAQTCAIKKQLHLVGSRTDIDRLLE